MSRKHRDRRDKDEMRLETNRSGFGGADACRSFAEKTFGPELKKVNMKVPESASAPDREKMRLYKKGGHVKRVHKWGGGGLAGIGGMLSGARDYEMAHPGTFHFKKGGKVKHKLNRDQVNEHFPTRAKTMKATQPSLEREEHKKKGGRVKKSFGGALGDSLMNIGSSPAGFRGLPPGFKLFKKGGHVKREKKFFGGLMGGGEGGNPLQGLGDLAGKFLGVRDSLASTLVPMMIGLKKGGHVKRTRKFDGGSMDMSAPGAVPVTAVPGMQGQQQKSGTLGSNTMQNAKRGGKMVKKAKGGSVYTREMVGEHPSRKRPHFNYEAEMRGEHGTKKAAFKKGGRVKKAGGGPLGNIARMVLPGFLGEMVGGLGFKKGGSINRDRAKVAHKAMGGMGRYSDGGMADVKPEGKMIKRAGGGMGRFAAGGVAKQRHGQATKRGTQMPNKRVPRGGGC